MDQQVSFLAFCKLCDHLARLKTRDSKKRVLQPFIEEWRAKDPGNLFSLYRLLLPHLDRSRMQLGIKDARLADLIIGALGLSKRSSDAVALHRTGMAGGKDFAARAASVVRERVPNPAGSGWSLAQLHRELDGLLDDPKSILERAIRQLSATELPWFLRLVLRTMPLGMADADLFKTLHPQASAHYHAHLDLQATCQELNDVSKKLRINLSCLRPFASMLAVAKGEIPSDPIVEAKLDGERVQLHWDGEVFRLFSRKGTDYTEDYGDFLSKLALKRPCILDGEMIAVKEGKFLPFSLVRPTAAGQTEGSLCLFLFDVVWLDGESLTEMPLVKRKAKLASCFDPVPGTMELIPTLPLDLKQAVAAGYEGLMVKDPASPYQIGERSSYWIKMKPDGDDSLANTMDVMVVGVQLGPESLRCVAVATQSQGGWRVVGRVGTGFTQQERFHLLGLLRPHLQATPPSWLWNLEAAGKIDRWLDAPEHGVVIEIILAGSKDHSDGEERFRDPRFMRMRHDKAPADTDVVESEPEDGQEYCLMQMEESVKAAVLQRIKELGGQVVMEPTEGTIVVAEEGFDSFRLRNLRKAGHVIQTPAQILQ